MVVFIEFELEAFNLLKEVPHEKLKVFFTAFLNTLRQAAGQ